MPHKLGVYTAILHDRPLDAALDAIVELGLAAAEINAGGFLPPVHIPNIDEILVSEQARDDYLEVFSSKGVTLAGLNVNGNPLHPNPGYGPRHAADLRRAIRAAGALGQTRVVAMSGLPAGEPGGLRPSWVVNPWSSGLIDMLDYQWDEVVVPFWSEIDRLAADNGVTVAIEMHPHNVAFNPPTLARLVERVGATNLGAEMDPSHLFWQQIDPVAAIRYLGPLVVHAAAKDVRINPNAAIYGVLDERFTRREVEEAQESIGGGEFFTAWPEESAWDFVALGRGHRLDFWVEFLDALYEASPDIAVNIEHEDLSLGRIEGLQVAAEVLLEAHARLSARKRGV